MTVLAEPFTTEDHWRFFGEFCKYDRLAGGPDPHMACVGEMSRSNTWSQKMWRAGCYVGVYNVPTAEIIWQEFDSYLPPGELEAWIDRHWDGIAFRRERRAVRSREKLARYLRSYASWVEGEHVWLDGPYSPEEAYEIAWRDVQRVYGMGRYVALKILEFMRRYCGAQIELPDMRPSGGWSPRAALALLYPHSATDLNSSRDDPLLNGYANHLFEDARRRLSQDHGVPLDRYNMQVLLCDYKQSVVGRRQYPGRSQDSELVYADKVHGHFGGEQTEMWLARANLFPHWALGELQGWDDVRGELGHVLAEHHYTWSDSKFDWHASAADLANPVPV